MLGPRELFYADIFASRRHRLPLHARRCRASATSTPAASASTSCAHDLFDFLLLSLPDNDNHSHRLGPDAQVAAIAQADRQLARMFEAGRRRGRFLAEHAVIVVADHAPHADRADGLARRRSSPTSTSAARPTCGRSSRARSRSARRSAAAMIYALRRAALLERVLARARRIDGVEHVMWRDGGEAVVERGGERSCGSRRADEVRRSARAALACWRASASVLDAAIEGERRAQRDYPDALGRDLGRARVRAGRRGAAVGRPTASSSPTGAAPRTSAAAATARCRPATRIAPLICCGLEGELDARQWSIADVAPLVARPFRAAD